jgi:hypothetical protein
MIIKKRKKRKEKNILLDIDISTPGIKRSVNVAPLRRQHLRGNSPFYRLPLPRSSGTPPFSRAIAGKLISQFRKYF